MNFEDWIGRTQESHDTLTPQHAAQWCATLDIPMPERWIMPQGVHFVLCTPDAPTSALGEDGHPARDESPDSFFPPFPLPRRMWASSDIRFIAPIAVGAVIKRTSRIASISEKDGASGKLAFVNVEHETLANGTLSVKETQTLVYREAAPADAPLSPLGASEGVFDASAWDAHRLIVPDERLLFRYSALTFNTHRIHYDAPYAQNVERYRGLVVHGPLTASLLLQMAASELGDNRLRHFAFRGVSPAIAGDPLNLVMRKSEDGFELGAFASDGRQVTKASVSL
ncbi:MaoC family dehydratase N-terminal domain-containing protein [Erythrobacter sp. SCSIO 43205]|uniref:FAS1-like dehydratase domain-containing protein n=1 Tax=Erythrobacter sp. SCSIO 43205 TaxID=2779361 RepID=UPI001CA8AEFA|nr:MaoC family dehydratase N-terminal domain-containing protein [Erythrobacter sp. SCSIO 43205]UAB78617.1 MaoC family dehydratase N-terminal domain-containing protein [Erythrobacter sp. SCSIO 43205]